MKKCEICFAVLQIRTKRGSVGNTRFCLNCRSVTILCDGCGIEMERGRSTYLKNQQNHPGRKYYHDYSCSAKYRERQKGFVFHKDSLPSIEYNPLILELFREECPDVLIYRKPFHQVGWEWDLYNSYMEPGKVMQLYKRQ